MLRVPHLPISSFLPSADVVPPWFTSNISIDDNGDRKADYTLLDMNPVTGIFEVSPRLHLSVGREWSLSGMCAGVSLSLPSFAVWCVFVFV